MRLLILFRFAWRAWIPLFCWVLVLFGAGCSVDDGRERTEGVGEDGVAVDARDRRDQPDVSVEAIKRYLADV
ncbi:MAG: hypothetical protein IIA40_11765, partial [SAR324 cluster bacterium]|nr:hypothetical protein [SAR324 cluster bacterium]